MKNLLESFSLTTGAILVALLSVAMVWALSFVSRPALRMVWAVVVPFALAYCLYWSPVWLGDDPSEYGAWAVLCVGVWFLAGMVASLVLVAFLPRRAAGQREQKV